MAAASAIKSKAISNIKDESDDLQASYMNINAIGNYQAANGDYINDTDIKNKYITDYNNRINSIYDKHKNDPLKAIPEIRMLGKEINANLTNGELSAVVGRYNGLQSDIATGSKHNEEYIKTGGKQGVEENEGSRSIYYNKMNNITPIKANDFGVYNG